MQNTLPRLLTVPQVGRELNLGRSTVYSLIAAGRLKVVRVGRAVRVTPEALDDFVRRLQEDGTDY